MKKLILAALLFFSCCAVAKEAYVTAYFTYSVKPPAELELYYQDKKLGSTSIHAASVSSISWVIEDIFGSQEVFEEKNHDLDVRIFNNVSLKVAEYTYSSDKK